MSTTTVSTSISVDSGWSELAGERSAAAADPMSFLTFFAACSDICGRISASTRALTSSDRSGAVGCLREHSCGAIYVWNGTLFPQQGSSIHLEDGRRLRKVEMCTRRHLSYARMHASPLPRVRRCTS